MDAISHCSHKNIVKFHQALRDDLGDLYIIMDLCDIDLKHKIRNDIEERKCPIEERVLVNILK